MSWEAHAWVWTLDGLTPLTKLVALSMANHAGPDGEHIRPSIHRVAEQTCVSEKTVKRAIADLIERGMLVLVDSSNGRGRTNEYSMPVDLQRVADRGTKKRGSSSDIETDKGGHWRGERGTLENGKGDIGEAKGGLCDPPILVQSLEETYKNETLHQSSLPMVGDDTIKNDHSSLPLSEIPPPRPSNDTRQPNSAKKASVDPMKGFDAFYGAYPRKVGRGAAERAWMSAIRSGATLETICAGLQWQIPKLREADPEFRPHPATWLNGKRYLDEPPAHLRPGYRQRMGSYEPSPEGGYDDPADDPGAMNGGF